MPETPHEQPQASSGAPEPSPRPESSAIAARLPREGRQGDSPGDCGTGTRCPRQGHTVHASSQAPPHPVTARLAAQRGPDRPQRRRRVGDKDGPRPRPGPAAPRRPRRLTRRLRRHVDLGAARGLLGSARGGAATAAAAAHAPWGKNSRADRCNTKKIKISFAKHDKSKHQSATARSRNSVLR